MYLNGGRLFDKKRRPKPIVDVRKGLLRKAADELFANHLQVLQPGLVL